MAKAKRDDAQDRDSWLAEALEMLREGGVDQVKVEPLAQRLGVTKGSFYWHFKNRDDLLRSLPEFWARSQTDPVLEVASRTEGGPLDKMRALLEFLAREDPDRYDNAMRAWAQFDEDVASAVKEIDERRMATARTLFEEAGLRPEDAAFRARLWYFYDVGEHVTGDTPADIEERLSRAAHRMKLLTSDLR
ncbi:MAG: TetR/AcrR family transcriptional regulator [Alphaproteobacteria bacterium]|nr:TetR/AcrR family transcriptional regulator [Alphaproteobacteria bacterium]